MAISGKRWENCNMRIIQGKHQKGIHQCSADPSQHNDLPCLTLSSKVILRRKRSFYFWKGQLHSWVWANRFLWNTQWHFNQLCLCNVPASIEDKVDVSRAFVDLKMLWPNWVDSITMYNRSDYWLLILITVFGRVGQKGQWVRPLTSAHVIKMLYRAIMAFPQGADTTSWLRMFKQGHACCFHAALERKLQSQQLSDIYLAVLKCQGSSWQFQV